MEISLTKSIIFNGMSELKESENNDQQQDWPKISIVTPSYNQGQYLEQTILSVINQGYPNLEYIIIDGGSSDNSVEIIKKYEGKISKWVSEKDKGQSDAINKGLKECTGTLFNWVNSDDTLPDGTLFHVGKMYKEKGFEILAGAVEEFDESGKRNVVVNQNLLPVNMLLKNSEMVFHQPGVWLLTKAVKKIGGINEKFQYCFDWELIIRYLLHFPGIVYTDRVLSCFRLHDLSKTVSSPIKFMEENVRITEEFKKKEAFVESCEKIEWWIRNKRWQIEVLKICNGNGTRLEKIVSILRSVNKDIKVRLSRYTAGSIKKLILS